MCIELENIRTHPDLISIVRAIVIGEQIPISDNNVNSTKINMILHEQELIRIDNFLLGFWTSEWKKLSTILHETKKVEKQWKCLGLKGTTYSLRIYSSNVEA